MKDRSDIKKEEIARLKEIYSQHPELFTERTFIDDEKTLKGIGIELPNKDHYPLGYLKLWPQDFIVEEIGTSGEIYSIVRENVLTSETTIDESQPTIYATLVKCGVSTIEVIRDLCAILDCPQENIHYAGIKDKDAITAQRISFKNISFEKLKQVQSNHFFLKDVISGKGIVQKSNLQGNRFTILIRTEKDFTTTDKFYTFAENLKHVKQHGFYNFYYLQRFGTPRLNNYLWALSVLKGDYKKAVFDIFSASGERELDYFKKLRKNMAIHFEDWLYIKNLIEPFPLMFPTETKIFEHLLENPDDYIGALRNISEQLTLWVYALSSYLFNRKISDAILLGQELPGELPLFLSFKQEDWMVYEKELKVLGIFPPPFRNFKPFPFIQMRSRTVSVKEHIDIHAAEVIAEGIILSFSLNKGDYATTFLSHLFNLASGLPTETISTEQMNTKEILKLEKIEPVQETLEYFKPVLELKDHSIFDTDK